MNRKLSKKLLPLLACLLLLPGCVAKRNAPADLADQLAYTNSVKAQYSIDEKWYRQYGNANINKLVDQALANNPDYLKAALNINRELYRLNLASADLYPTLSGSLDASVQRAAFKNDHTLNNFSSEIGVNYEIDLYGKIKDARSAQVFEYRATVMDREAARLSLVNSVVDLYFNLEYLDNSIGLTRGNINHYRDILQLIQRKSNAGKVDGLEPALAEQNLLSEQKRLMDLETQYKEVEQSLRNILNIPPGKNPGISYSNILNQKTVRPAINVPLSVLANRPDLIASQYRLDKAFKELRAEDKNWYPSISIAGALSSSSDKARTAFDIPYSFGGVSVSLPFLDWTRVRNNVRISETEYQTTLIEFRDTLNQALNEVAYYHYAYLKALAIYNNTMENSRKAALVTSYYKTRYDNGKSELKDYLEAVHTENSLRKDLLQNKYQVIKYENYVYKAMGGRYAASK